LAKDGERALEILRHQPDVQLCVMDWMMPGMSGVDVCRELRLDSSHYVYVVLLTARTGSEDVIEGLQAGADDYVLKPCNPHELEMRLRAGRRVVELERKLLAMQEQLRIEATHDALTGLLNRRAIFEELGRELARSRRASEHFSVVMCDVDHFKRVNDTYGHGGGDAVLRALPRLISSELREYDRLGRYGGEEFLVLLANCQAHEAVRVAERVRARIERSKVEVGELQLQITMSFGVAGSDQGPGGIEGIVAAADAALYRAKNRGRNRALIADGADLSALIGAPLERTAPTTAA
jgi:two-component system, cell cycle response regulator